MMATEVSPLVSDRTTSSSTIMSKIYTTVKRRYRVYVYSRGAYVVLLFYALVYGMLYGHGTITHSHLMANVWNVSLSNGWSYAIILPASLLYPFIGVLGMFLSRYTLINAAVVMVVGAKSLLLILNIVTIASDVVKGIITCFIYIFYYYAMGMMIINFVPLGLDQLLFASSEKVQTYIYCATGTIFLVWTLVGSLFACLALFVNLFQFYHLRGVVVVDTALALLVLVISLLVACCCRKHINIEPPPPVNPVKHIYKVMKYAWLNKYPARRSAYTYTERPSRLDLCKKRYGGPFTTDEVEDVKSFWRILVLLFSMFGVFCFDVTIGIADTYQKYMNESSYTSASFPEVITILYPSTVICGSVSMCVLIYQLIFYPFLSRYLPRLLHRMGMGLFLGFCASCCLTLLSLWLDRELFPYGLLAIPQVLYGCAYFLSFITTIEFIIAQSPLRLQGMLLGIFMLFAVCSFILSAILAKKGNHWEYYAIKSVLSFLSCLTFLVASMRYKYRERNELTDVNERLIIAEYTERQLASRDDSDENDHNIHISYTN